jgi:hypothetical protein
MALAHGPRLRLGSLLAIMRLGQAPGCYAPRKKRVQAELEEMQAPAKRLTVSRTTQVSALTLLPES